MIACVRKYRLLLSYFLQLLVSSINLGLNQLSPRFLLIDLNFSGMTFLNDIYFIYNHGFKRYRIISKFL